MKLMGCTTESKSIDYWSYWHAELGQKYQLRKLMGCTAKFQKVVITESVGMHY
jgi:hypothetical protein